MDDELYVSGAPAVCLHCGAFTILCIRAEYNYTLDGEGYSGTKDMNRIRWSLLQCTECSAPTLLQSTMVTSLDKSSLSSTWKTSVEAIKALYPADPQVAPSLPKQIGKLYAEALKVKLLSPSSCAVLVRRTLEAVCQHENATGRTLANKLKGLAESGKIPQTLVNVAFHLKQLGNLGAHFDVNDDVTTEDVSIILDFVDLFLEYLYVAPAKIQAVKDRLSRSRSSGLPANGELDEHPF